MQLHELTEFSITAFSAVFFVVDPFAAIPLFLTMTKGSTPKQRRSTALKAATTVVVALLVFALAGGLIFRMFGISIGAFRVAGGLLLFLMAVDMMRAQPSGTRSSEAEVAEGQEKNEPGVVPLGLPMLAGPGAIATVSVLMSSARASAAKSSIVLLCVVVTALITYFVLHNAVRLERMLKTTGMNVLNRVMGLILAAVAVQFVATGVRELFPILAEAAGTAAPGH
jgi:multiple antibiotic resistance protein